MNLPFLLASPGCAILFKWTGLLALGWAAHGLLRHHHARLAGDSLAQHSVPRPGAATPAMDRNSRDQNSGRQRTGFRNRRYRAGCADRHRQPDSSRNLNRAAGTTTGGRQNNLDTPPCFLNDTKKHFVECDSHRDLGSRLFLWRGPAPSFAGPACPSAPRGRAAHRRATAVGHTNSNAAKSAKGDFGSDFACRHFSLCLRRFKVVSRVASPTTPRFGVVPELVLVFLTLLQRQFLQASNFDWMSSSVLHLKNARRCTMAAFSPRRWWPSSRAFPSASG